MYERLFSWLIQKLNNSLCNQKYKDGKNVIGLLDIYGFEILKLNSFEQLCINYTNERLQQLFIELTLKSEQEKYKREEIRWESVDFFDNKIICDLIEEKHRGIIAILDEECVRPGDATDSTFLTKLHQLLGEHPNFSVHLQAIGNVHLNGNLNGTINGTTNGYMNGHHHLNGNSQQMDTYNNNSKQSNKNLLDREHFRINHYAGLCHLFFLNAFSD